MYKRWHARKTRSRMVQLSAVVLLTSAVLLGCGQTTPQFPPPGREPVDVAGAWELTLTEPGGPSLTVDMLLTQQGSTLSGSADSDQVVQYSVIGSIVGASIKLTLQVVGVPGVDLRFTLDGTATKTSLTGTYTINGSPGIGSFVGAKGPTTPPPPPSGVDVSGAWILTTTNDSNGAQGTYLLSLAETAGTIDGLASFETGGSYPGTAAGTLSGSSISLMLSISILPNPSDPKLEVLFVGTATSTQLTGTFQVLSTNGASGPATARRPGTTPPPPPPSTGLEISIENTTFTDMHITIHDRAPVTVAPGRSATATFAANPGSVRVQAWTSGSTTSGTQVGLKLTWDFTYDTVGATTLSRRFVVGNDKFFLKIRNQGSQPLTELRVNYGLQSETVDYVSIPNSGSLIGTGYYRAFTNSRVEARLGSSSTVVRWDNLGLPFTQNQSITLTNQY